MIALYILLGFAALTLLLMAVCLMPRRGIDKRMQGFITDYAHRGLYGGGIPENSLPAFENAARQGVAIELDVMLTSDGEVVVFHDDRTGRMCGEDLEISKIDLTTLKSLYLSGSGERIPLLTEVLETVGGRVPLLIELKGMGFDTSLCDATHRILSSYGGKYCVESFNPFLIRCYATLAPEIPRGLLAFRFKKGSVPFPVAFLCRNALTGLICRIDFVAYRRDDRLPLCIKICRMLGAKLMLWTVRGEEQMKEDKKRSDAIIFEKEGN